MTEFLVSLVRASSMAVAISYTYFAELSGVLHRDELWQSRLVECLPQTHDILLYARMFRFMVVNGLQCAVDMNTER